MLYHTAAQGSEFALMLLAGMLMSAAACAFSAVRRLTCAGRLLSLACDALMGAVWAALGCACLLVASRGSLRLFHLLAVASGAALFHAAAAVPLAVIACRTRRCCTGVAKKLCENRLLRAIFR